MIIMASEGPNDDADDDADDEFLSEWPFMMMTMMVVWRGSFQYGRISCCLLLPQSEVLKVFRRQTTMAVY